MAQVRFFSKAKNYQILVRPYIIKVENGMPQHIRGEKIEFNNGEFVTDQKQTIDFLRKHRAFGIDFVEDSTSTDARRAERQAMSK